MHLSNQAKGAIMMALQESLLNEMDIVHSKGIQVGSRQMTDSLWRTRQRSESACSAITEQDSAKNGKALCQYLSTVVKTAMK